MQPSNNRESQRGAGSIQKAPQAADSSSSSSSSSESSTDTEMGLVDLCTILCFYSEAVQQKRATGRLVAVAEGRVGGPTKLDSTKWDFNKTDCRNKCRIMVENSKPLLLIGPPIDSGRENKERARGERVLHLAFICELHEIQLHGGAVHKGKVDQLRELERPPGQRWREELKVLSVFVR